MTDASNRAVIDKRVTAISSADVSALNTVFTEDVVLEWRAPSIEPM